jgi:hypothetical protein
LTVSLSSTEAEIKAIIMVSKQILVMRDILTFLGHEQTEPTKLYVDNKSAIDMCKTLKTTHNTGHINTRIHFIRELVNARILLLIFVPSKLNVSDMLTKAVERSQHERHTTVLLRGHEAVQDGSLLFLSVQDYPTQEDITNAIENDEAVVMILAETD